MRSAQVANNDATPTGSFHRFRGDKSLDQTINSIYAFHSQETYIKTYFLILRQHPNLLLLFIKIYALSR